MKNNTDLTRHSTHVKTTSFIDISVLTILLVFFYGYYLGHYPLFIPDEGRYAEVAREMIATGDYITPRVNGVAFLDKPILYYWLEVLALKWFGISEWSIRMMPALLGILGCTVTYLCASTLFNRMTGLLASIILATTPLYFAGAHYANLDLEVAVFISSALLCFLTGVETVEQIRHRYLYAAYIFASLACLTKGLIGLVFPILISSIWLIQQQRLHHWRQLRVFTGILIFCAIVIPWYVLVQIANPKFLHYFFFTQQVERFLAVNEYNNKTPVWFYVPIIIIGVLPWSIYLASAGWRFLKQLRARIQPNPVTVYLWLWAICVFAFFSIPRSKTVGYILPITPAIALIVAHELQTQWHNAHAIYRYAQSQCGTLILFCLGLLILLHNPIHDDFVEFQYYFYGIVFSLLIFSILAWRSATAHSLLPLMIASVFCVSSNLLIITMGIEHLNKNSLKPLTLYLKQILQPEDEVIHYFRFYQDVPIYLNHNVHVVADWQAAKIQSKDNWVREFWFGQRLQLHTPWLINDDDFWARWYSTKRVFVFMHMNYFVLFQPRVQHYYYLGNYHDVVLLSNQALTSSEQALEHPAFE